MSSFSPYHWIIVLLIYWIILYLIFLQIVNGIAVMGAQEKIVAKHTQSGLQKNGYIGYCWTYVLFGGFVPIFRGEIGIGLTHIFLSTISLGMFNIVMSYYYNFQHMKRLVTNGWVIDETELDTAFAKMKLGIVRL